MRVSWTFSTSALINLALSPESVLVAESRDRQLACPELQAGCNHFDSQTLTHTVHQSGGHDVLEGQALGFTSWETAPLAHV